MGLLVLAACEHAKYWRGGEPYDRAFIARMADPYEAKRELDGRMTQTPHLQKLPKKPDGSGRISADEWSLQQSSGCMTCHGLYDKAGRTMHGGSITAAVGCVGCHGGDASITSPLDAPGRPGATGTSITDESYLAAMQSAHVQPRNPQAWYGRHDDADFGSHHAARDPALLHGSRNPEITAALLNQESPEFVRFINPGDLRIVDYTCGSCHYATTQRVKHSMMAHGAQLWAAALYNNGSIPNKIPIYGESYSPFGLPQMLQGVVEIPDGRNRESLVRAVTSDEAARGVVPYLTPLPVWNISQPGNILRIFERGTKLPIPGGATPNANPAEIGNPNALVEGGRPDKALSPRGLGTLNRTDPVFIGLQKTRLLDPTLNVLGTNDHPGDYRSSGCTACHVPYANDRDPSHSGEMLAKFGHMGFAGDQTDPNIPKDESGHPVRHVLTSAVPNSQCITCHIHPGTSYANTYLGYMWWDNESDGEFFYPNRSHTPTAEQEAQHLRRNPESAALKGLWGNLYPDAVSHAGERSGPDFLERSGALRRGDGTTLNDRLKHNQIADFHGHGWVFRAVHKKDRTGNLLDAAGNIVAFDDPDKWAKAVHLQDVHLARGMHCVDCHFSQDVHGDGRLYGEVRNAIEITCIDCHGTYTQRATLKTSGPAALNGGTNLATLTALNGPQFERRGDIIIQRSAVERGKQWTIPQTVDTINPDSEWAQANPEAAALSRRAKTMRRDGATWGDMKVEEGRDLEFAHSAENMECYTCHTSWMTSCFGCHLPMEANQRAPMLHNESLFTRNYTRYNFQVLRDDVFMLGKDSTVKGGRVVPVRSSSAVLVSSQNANREWIYHQQQTVSAEGYSGQAFNPHFPHATGGRGTTKMCIDCHLSKDDDNNAWMAQLFLQGTNFVNFIGRYAYVAAGREGIEAVIVTEHDDPQAVIGSNLHHLAYPDEHARFVEEEQRTLRKAHHHSAGGGNEILDVQLRGEYLYTARGAGGFFAYDVANIDNKGFSERIVTAPVSPLGQKLGFDTSYAVAVASPSTLAVDPARSRMTASPSPGSVGEGRGGGGSSPSHASAPLRRASASPLTGDSPSPIPASNGAEDADPIAAPDQPHYINEEQPIHPLYAYLYIGDREEGLILTFAGTLLDGDPTNNFMERATLADGSTAYNPDGLLTGMTHLTLAGHYIYATSPAGLVVININNPLEPRIESVAGSDALINPRSVAVQFRYAFITDERGLHVADITDPAAPRLIDAALIELGDAHRVYVARTNVFVAAGSQGLAIIDVTNPEQPALDQLFTADGAIDDARDVKVGMTNASLFAYVADGRNGLRVIELMGPHTTPQFRGFSPPLHPRLIATYHTHGPALAVSKGLDRDRAVDESGHQVAVFGRLGSRPLNLEEMQRLFLRNDAVWKVSNRAETEPRPFAAAEEKKEEAAPVRPPRRPGQP